MMLRCDPYPQLNGTLKLCGGAPRLPTLANHSFIVGKAKKADVVWSEDDFLALCEHMLNGNPLSHFLNVWLDVAGHARFAKASIRRRADKHASWSWNTINEKAKCKTA